MPGPPAPLPPEDVARALLPFGRSRTLPAAAYRSGEVFAWERWHLLGASWFCVGRAAELGANEQRAADVAGAGVLLVRDEAGRCVGSTTSAGTAATSCLRRASGRPGW